MNVGHSENDAGEGVGVAVGVDSSVAVPVDSSVAVVVGIGDSVPVGIPLFPSVSVGVDSGVGSGSVVVVPSFPHPLNPTTDDPTNAATNRRLLVRPSRIPSTSVTTLILPVVDPTDTFHCSEFYDGV